MLYQIRLIETDVDHSKTSFLVTPRNDREKGFVDCPLTILDDRKFVLLPSDPNNGIFLFDPISAEQPNLIWRLRERRVWEMTSPSLDRKSRRQHLRDARLRLSCSWQARGLRCRAPIAQTTIGVHASMRHLYYRIQYFKAHGVNDLLFWLSSGRA